MKVLSRRVQPFFLLVCALVPNSVIGQKRSLIKRNARKRELVDIIGLVNNFLFQGQEDRIQTCLNDMENQCFFNGRRELTDEAFTGLDTEYTIQQILGSGESASSLARSKKDHDARDKFALEERNDEFPMLTALFKAQLLGDSKSLFQEMLIKQYVSLSDIFPRLNPKEFVENILFKAHGGQLEPEPRKHKDKGKKKPKPQPEDEDKANDDLLFFLGPFGNPSMTTALQYAFFILLIPLALLALEEVLRRLVPGLASAIFDSELVQLLLGIIFPFDTEDDSDSDSTFSIGDIGAGTGQYVIDTEQALGFLRIIEEHLQGAMDDVVDKLKIMDEGGVLDQISALEELECYLETIYCKRSEWMLTDIAAFPL